MKILSHISGFCDLMVQKFHSKALTYVKKNRFNQILYIYLFYKFAPTLDKIVFTFHSNKLLNGI